MDIPKETIELPKSEKVAITICIYDEICSKKKLCGDCAADQYDMEKYEEGMENYQN